MSYPINLDVENKICVVVGGGRVAARKVRALLDAKANVIVIAPDLCADFPSVQPMKELPSTVFCPAGLFDPTRPHFKKPLGQDCQRLQAAFEMNEPVQPSAAATANPFKAAPFELKESAQPSAPTAGTLHNDFIWLKRKYEVGCLPRGVLLIAATNDPEVNRQAAIEATEKNMLVNAVDGSNDVGLQFENPSTIRRGELLLTISTGGKSPALSKFIRQRLEKIFDDNFARQLDTIEQMRDEIKNAINDPDKRITFWQQFMNEQNFFPTVDSEELGVKIRNALKSYRAQSQHRTD